jgi:RNA polymerase sigma-70 factor (ECF subfamily)
MTAPVASLYAKYGPMVLRRCRRLLRDEAQAVDAMHDVFVLVTRHQHRLDTAAPSSLLYRLATNVCLNHLRTAQRRPEDADDEVVLSIARDLDLESRTHARSLLARLFAEEPESTATIAVLHYLDGMTWEEVAAEVGLSISGVRKRARGLAERLQLMEGVEDVP